MNREGAPRGERAFRPAMEPVAPKVSAQLLDEARTEGLPDRVP